MGVGGTPSGDDPEPDTPKKPEIQIFLGSNKSGDNTGGDFVSKYLDPAHEESPIGKLLSEGMNIKVENIDDISGSIYFDCTETPPKIKSAGRDAIVKIADLTVEAGHGQKRPPIGHYSPMYKPPRNSMDPP